MFQPYDEPFSFLILLFYTLLHTFHRFSPQPLTFWQGKHFSDSRISLQSRNHPVTTKRLYSLNTLNNRSSQYVFWCISDADNIGLTQKPVLEDMQQPFQGIKSSVCTPSFAETWAAVMSRRVRCTLILAPFPAVCLSIHNWWQSGTSHHVSQTHDLSWGWQLYAMINTSVSRISQVAGSGTHRDENPRSARPLSPRCREQLCPTHAQPPPQGWRGPSTNPAVHLQLAPSPDISNREMAPADLRCHVLIFALVINYDGPNTLEHAAEIYAIRKFCTYFNLQQGQRGTTSIQGMCFVKYKKKNKALLPCQHQ